MDGEITIGISANTDKFDKQIKKLEEKMADEEKKKIKIDADVSDMQQKIADFEKAEQEAKQYGETIKQLQAERKKLYAEQPELIVGQSQEIDTINAKIDETIDKRKQAYDILTKEAPVIDKLRSSLAEQEEKQTSINNKIQEYKQQIESVKLQQHVAEVNRMKDSFDNVGSSIRNAIGHVGRLALGIFEIRSAFLALRRASSDLANYDKQYAANLEYIRYALTQAIAPVLQWIVRLAATLLGYINAIMQGWFGINLFSRGSAENFNKMKAGAGGVSKAVKEIKKQLTGFDEINMLTDQSDTGTKSGAGGFGTQMPSFDLSAMQGEVPEWLQWIIDHKDEILSTLAGIGAGFVFLKLGELAKNLGLIKGEMLGIKAIGFGILVKGIIDLIVSLRDYLKDPSWENFGKVVKAIGEIILGVGILIGNVPLIVAGAIITIVGLIIKHWEEIKAFLQRGIDWLKGKSEWVHQMFGNFIGNIYDMFVQRLQLILNWFDSTFKNMKRILDGIIQFIKGVFTGNWKQAWEGIRKIFSGILNAIVNTAVTVFNLIFGKAVAISQKTGETISNVFKAIVNAVLGTIERVLNSPIRAVNRLLDVINAVPGINLGYLSTFNLPRLKTGAIINMPNRGTLVGGGNAIAGEAGREGILPLDDRTAMAQLGEEIGKHVVVNLTNITKMNGRVIGRELKQVQNEQEFAFNN